MSTTVSTSSALDLAEHLCSRLCHDLLSPVGALGNGLELLADENDPEMRRRCFDLLGQSARISADKLKFFRLAFGAAGRAGDTIAVAEPRALIEALVGEGGRIGLNWAVASETMAKPAVKTLLNLALIGIEALVRGGTLDIGAEQHAGGDGGGATEIVVRASGPRIAFDPAVGSALDGSLATTELSSRTAAAAMLHLLAAEHGGAIQYALGDDALVLGAVLPQG